MSDYYLADQTGLNVGRMTDDDWSVVGRDAAARLISGTHPVIVSVEPGNGARYDVMLVPIQTACTEVLGAPEDVMGTAKEPRPFDHKGYLVALPEFRSCYTFALAGYQEAGYVADKLRLSYADGAVVANVLMAIDAALTEGR